MLDRQANGDVKDARRYNADATLLRENCSTVRPGKIGVVSVRRGMFWGFKQRIHRPLFSQLSLSLVSQSVQLRVSNSNAHTNRRLIEIRDLSDEVTVVTVTCRRSVHLPCLAVELSADSQNMNFSVSENLTCNYIEFQNTDAENKTQETFKKVLILKI